MPKKPSEMTDEELRAAYKTIPVVPAMPAMPTGRKASELSDEELKAAYEKINAPSFGEDIKEGLIPALERGFIGLHTSPFTMADLALKGAGIVSRHLPFTSDETANTLSAPIEGLRDRIDPYTYGGAVDKAAAYDPNIKHQNRTIPGQFVQTIEEAAPGTAAAVLTGGEAALPTIVKGVSSALGSETAGQLADYFAPDSGFGSYARMIGSLFGIGGPATVRKAMSPGTRTTSEGAERLAKTQTIEAAGGKVSAAQQTGSPWWSTLEGRPPKRQMAKFSETMREKGNLPPGLLGASLTARNAALDAERSSLLSNTAVDVTKDLKKRLTDEVNAHTKMPYVDPNVVEGMKVFNKSVVNNKLPGDAYANIRSNWYQGPKAQQNMARHLDDAMETSHPGQWSGYFDNVADYKALEEGAKHAHEGIIPPASVAPTRPTELAKLAQAGRMIEPGRYPRPYNTEAGLTSGVGAAAALLKGSEGGVLGYLLSHGLPMLGRMTTGPIARSAPVQAWGKLHYWSPNAYTRLPNMRTGAMLLGQPAGQFFNSPDEPPEEPQQ